MRRKWILIGLLWATAAGFAAATACQAAQEQGPCEQILAACQGAGFVTGGAKSGNGLYIDCIAPIMQGKTRARRAGKPLPQIEPAVVTACRAQNPNFGQPKGQQSATVPEQPVAAPAADVAQAPASPAGPADSPLPTGPPRSGGGKRPNIVFILTDDLSLNLVQYMPHVLKMQKQGVTFANYFVTDSLCCPSRSSIFTGRYPHDTGVFKNTGMDGGYRVFVSRGNEQVSFATALAAGGYRTGFMGKYLNGYEPEQNPKGPGWTTWDVAGNGYGEFRYALNQDGQVVRYDHKPKDYLTDVVADLGVRFVKQKGGAPFIIEIATFAPHAPYTPAPRDADAFRGLRAPRTPAYNAPPDADAVHWLTEHPALTEADMAAIDMDFRKRAQSVLAVDKMIGELEAAVAAIGQEKNTYFIFSSDNGYHMGEHRLMPGKMTAYDTDIHVPLIITGPGVPAGRTVEEIVANIDLCPTFADLAGATPPPNVDGVSLVPLLLGQSAGEWRNVTLVEHHGALHDPLDPDAPAVRSGNPTTYEALRARTWVYVQYADGEREYHDRTADPDELRNAYPSLSSQQKVALSATVEAVKNCHNARNCWAAQRANPIAPRQ